MKIHRPALSLFLLLLSVGCASGPQVRAADAGSRLTDPELALLAAHRVDGTTLACNTRRTWNPTLRAEAKSAAAGTLADLAKLGVSVPPEKAEEAHKLLTSQLFWRMVRATLIDGNQNNLGVVAVAGVTTSQGEPLLVFRTGFTPSPERPDSCVRSLTSAGVRHGVNLYHGPMPTADLERAEAETIRGSGGTYFSVSDDPQLASWRDELRDDPTSRAAAEEAIVRVIEEGILHPHGQAPTGHVLVHCGGGMHRTGMVMGVLERCWNRAPQAVWEAAYKRHVAWESDAQPGGFEPANLAFVAQFDCTRLTKNREATDKNR